jgi:hypothetical protein
MNMYLEALDFMWPQLNSSYLLGFLVKKTNYFLLKFLIVNALIKNLKPKYF